MANAGSSQSAALNSNRVQQCRVCGEDAVAPFENHITRHAFFVSGAQMSRYRCSLCTFGHYDMQFANAHAVCEHRDLWRNGGVIIDQTQTYRDDFNEWAVKCFGLRDIEWSPYQSPTGVLAEHVVAKIRMFEDEFLDLRAAWGIDDDDEEPQEEEKMEQQEEPASDSGASAMPPPGTTTTANDIVSATGGATANDITPGVVQMECDSRPANPAIQQIQPAVGEQQLHQQNAMPMDTSATREQQSVAGNAAKSAQQAAHVNTPSQALRTSLSYAAAAQKAANVPAPFPKCRTSPTAAASRSVVAGASQSGDMQYCPSSPTYSPRSPQLASDSAAEFDEAPQSPRYDAGDDSSQAAPQPKRVVSVASCASLLQRAALTAKSCASLIQRAAQQGRSDDGAAKELATSNPPDTTGDLSRQQATGVEAAQPMASAHANLPVGQQRAAQGSSSNKPGPSTPTPSRSTLQQWRDEHRMATANPSKIIFVDISKDRFIKADPLADKISASSGAGSSSKIVAKAAVKTAAKAEPGKLAPLAVGAKVQAAMSVAKPAQPARQSCTAPTTPLRKPYRAPASPTYRKSSPTYDNDGRTSPTYSPSSPCCTPSPPRSPACELPTSPQYFDHSPSQRDGAPTSPTYAYSTAMQDGAASPRYSAATASAQSSDVPIPAGCEANAAASIEPNVEVPLTDASGVATLSQASSQSPSNATFAAGELPSATKALHERSKLIPASNSATAGTVSNPSSDLQFPHCNPPVASEDEAAMEVDKNDLASMTSSKVMLASTSASAVGPAIEEANDYSMQDSVAVSNPPSNHQFLNVDLPVVASEVDATSCQAPSAMEVDSPSDATSTGPCNVCASAGISPTEASENNSVPEVSPPSDSPNDAAMEVDMNELASRTSSKGMLVSISASAIGSATAGENDYSMQDSVAVSNPPSDYQFLNVTLPVASKDDATSSQASSAMEVDLPRDTTSAGPGIVLATEAAENNSMPEVSLPFASPNDAMEVDMNELASSSQSTERSSDQASPNPFADESANVCYETSAGSSSCIHSGDFGPTAASGSGMINATECVVHPQPAGNEERPTQEFMPAEANDLAQSSGDQDLQTTTLRGHSSARDQNAAVTVTTSVGTSTNPGASSTSTSDPPASISTETANSATASNLETSPGAGSSLDAPSDSASADFPAPTKTFLSLHPAASVDGNRELQADEEILGAPSVVHGRPILRAARIGRAAPSATARRALVTSTSNAATVAACRKRNVSQEGDGAPSAKLAALPEQRQQISSPVASGSNAATDFTGMPIAGGSMSNSDPASVDANIEIEVEIEVDEEPVAEPSIIPGRVVLVAARGGARRAATTTRQPAAVTTSPEASMPRRKRQSATESPDDDAPLPKKPAAEPPQRSSTRVRAGSATLGHGRLLRSSGLRPRCPVTTKEHSNQLRDLLRTARVFMKYKK